MRPNDAQMPFVRRSPVEFSTVQFGTTVLNYRLRRTERKKTVSIAVDPQAGIIVTAPEQATKKRIDDLVRQKGPWLVKRIKRQSDLPAPLPKREYVSGETYLYLGKQYRLRVQRGPTEEPVRLYAGALTLTLKEGLGPLERTKTAKSRLVAWYKERSRRYLTERLHVWERKLQLTATKVLIAEPRKRWGSTSADGSVRLNWRLIQAPSSLVDYVLLHELVHLLHKDHNREFWATLGRVMPDYDDRKSRLRELGPRMVW